MNRHRSIKRRTSTTRDGTDGETVMATRPALADRVAAGLAGINDEFHALTADPPAFSDHAGWARYCTAMAWNNARRAGWWGLLARASAKDPTVSYAHTLAAWVAWGDARSDARFYRETAREYRERADEDAEGRAGVAGVTA